MIKKSVTKILFVMAIIFLCLTLVCTDPITVWGYGTNIRLHFNNWEDNPYNSPNHDCSEMTNEVEEYVETQLGLDCYFVYGSNRDASHIWTIIEINSKFYEFESTSLVFSPSSNKYNVQCVQRGFYVDGTRYETSQPYDNWEHIFCEMEIGD